MKVFFTSTTQGQDEFGSYYRQIYDEIKKLGYSHLDSDIVDTTFKGFVDDVVGKGREGYIKYFKKKEDGVKNADICIFEVSYPTLGLGFMIDVAIKLGKPTIILYYGDLSPHTLAGVEDEKLILRSYDEKNLKKVVKDVLQEAREKRDKRFNFFLSPKLLDYLDKAAKMEGATKSKLLRDMILRHMRENNESTVE